MNKQTHAQNIDPGFKTFLVAQNPTGSPEVVHVETDADKASEAAWSNSRTLAIALGKKRTQRSHGTKDGQPARAIEHDPYGTYRADQADVKNSDAPALQTDRLSEGVFTHSEVANIEAAEKLALSDYEAPADSRKAA